MSTLTTPPNAHDEWSVGPVTLPSGKHIFTMEATEPSLIGNAAGKSKPQEFEVDTLPPEVRLDSPKSPSNETTPLFSGTASEKTPVTVSVYRGSTTEGKPAATVEAPGTGGDWTSAPVSPRLEEGEYTAVATQPSSIKNAPGQSKSVHFVVITKSPEVFLNPIPSPSSIRAATFSGTASDYTPVTVDIYKGPNAEGQVVASATAEGTGSEWVSGTTNPRLEWGEYTAVATQPSSIGNAPGKSKPITFTLEQIPPVAIIDPASGTRAHASQLNGYVDPNGGLVSSCLFEYGTTTSYGATAECEFADGLTVWPSGGTSAVPVFARIFGLSPNTTYHVRLVAVDEGGIGTSADETFTTPGEPSNERLEVHPSTAGHSVGKTAGGVAAWLAAQLNPPVRATTIALLLKRGVYDERFKAPESGTAVIEWFYVPPGAKLAKKAKRSPVLVASGRLVFGSAGTGTIKVRLTAKGKHLLRTSKRIQLTAVCSFTPVGEKPLKTSRSFELKR